MRYIFKEIADDSPLSDIFGIDSYIFDEFNEKIFFTTV